ncbi:hypothetical protein ACH427_28440 [Streptomyces sp. NPDC020379]|uniref:hypothetical protein n=1 Tax=Streptomyces sp. NPDC020379 TaxID=3365071 RepID=UPI0037A48078
MAIGRAWTRTAALATAVTALVATAPAAASAHEHPSPAGQLQCSGTETVGYRPGVTLAPRDVGITVQGRFTRCTDSTGKVTSGAYDEHFPLFTGCNNLLEGFTAERTFKWNTGDSSTAEISGSSTAVAGQVITTITGTVVKGRFQGRSVEEVIILPQPGALDCLTTGFTGATGGTTLALT